MRRIILSVFLLICTVIVSAQLTSSLPSKSYTNLPGIDYVFIFNGITPNSEITYTGTYTVINWYKITDTTTPITSGQNFISPENGTGYILNVDGILTHFWVIDYSSYIPVINSIQPENNPGAQCENVKLLIDANIPILSYQSVDGLSHTLPRDFTIKYQTLTWGGTAWKTIDTIQTVVLPTTQISVKAPYIKTVFTLSGDQYATDLGLNQVKDSSLSYTPVAVISHLTNNVTSRDQGSGNNNEGSFPTAHLVTLEISAPIDVQFLSNANEPVTQHYIWYIFKDKKQIITRTDKDERYTFTEAGNYIVKLTVSNATCSFSDSIAVIVSESAIYVPDVFTPNGDGHNDQFKVAYKSLLTFQCWVYNRWGREVYYWNDPQKGWDGNINGKKAVPGPYFYVIKATGSDKKVYKLKGDINLLR